VAAARLRDVSGSLAAARWQRHCQQLVMKNKNKANELFLGDLELEGVN
jgi:hypothetical protein